MRFSRRLSPEEISDCFRQIDESRFGWMVSTFDFFPEARKILKKHQALFRDCARADIGPRIDRVIGKWPDVSSDEFALVSDLVTSQVLGESSDVSR